MPDRVLITQPIDGEAMALLDAVAIPTDVWPGPEPISRTELLRRVAGCAGLISMLTDPVDAEVMDAGPLRVIAQHAVGVNNIDLEGAAARGICVAHTPGVLTHATADLAMTLVLSVARRVLESDHLVRSGDWKGWSPTLMRGMELRGATMGIIGMGRIGSAVAQRARAFGMEIVHHNRTSGMPLDDLLRMSDVVSLHCPLTPSTRHLIDGRALSLMKTTAILVNTARGPVVDEAALVGALDTGTIGGAGLDVFEEEPRVHPGLLATRKAVLLPHIGSATTTTRRAMGRMVVEDIIKGLRGEALSHKVKSR
jgi:glyoxylate reductase